MLRFEVLILGNSSATPMYGRHPTAQVLNYNEQFYLIDCGEGTQMQLSRYGVKSNRINHIFISHLHGDHYLGLMGLLSSMHLMGRKAKLHLYGPAALEEILSVQFKHSSTSLQYPLIIHPTNPLETEVIMDTPGLKVTSFPLQHRIDCTGFRFDEGKRPASLNADLLAGLNIPIPYLKLLKKGVDYVEADGTVHSAATLTLPGPMPRSYAFCSDTLMNTSYFEAIADVDLLYHEATFLQDMKLRAQETLHSTSIDAAEVALAVKAKKLLLGHFSARYRDLQPFLMESRTIFPATLLSEEGKWFLI